MSSRRSRQQSGSSRTIEDQIIDLISKLQQLLPELRSRGRSDKVSTIRVLQEACDHIKSLHREADDLSGRLSQLLDNISVNDDEAEIIRSLFM